MSQLKLYTGILVLLMILFFVSVGPLIYKIDPNSINLMSIESAPTDENILGTDSIGRDILARLMFGGRVSLQVGIIATSVKIVIAAVLGFLAGFFKTADMVIMRVTDVFMCFPFYILAMSMAAFIGPSTRNLIIIIAFFTFAPATRLIRTEIKTIKEKEFIKICQINGENYLNILIRHILPNLRNTILVIYTTSVAQAILMESSLSFLAMGIKEPQSSWGSMLSVTLNVLNIGTKWWLWLPAGLLVLLLTYSIHLIGEGIINEIDS